MLALHARAGEPFIVFLTPRRCLLLLASPPVLWQVSCQEQCVMPPAEAVPNYISRRAMLGQVVQVVETLNKTLTERGLDLLDLSQVISSKLGEL